ncbi:MAG: crotonase/enoyl-CoA hydratase family protein [bacterium]|nr:crotonase/enoyl-CoA hydratase family protein [bacterium]
MSYSDYPFFEVEKDATTRVAHLYLNRPSARNAMNWPYWRDLPLIVDELEADPEVRVVIVAARGKSFSTGLDLVDFFQEKKSTFQAETADGREALQKMILEMQAGTNRMAEGQNIYIAAVHRHCIGGGLDLIAACDLRLASKDASISLREAKVAIVADMGSLNRLPGIIGMGYTRLMAYTARDFSAAECEKMGLLEQVFDSQAELMDGARALAEEISANSSIAVRGTKQVLNYVADHSLDDSLKYVATWNAAFLDSKDLREMFAAFTERRRPKFQ